MSKKCKKCKDWQNCVNHMYCYVCKRNPLLTYGSDWSPEDFYQPKFATGWEGWGVAFPLEPELIVSMDPADGKDYSATVITERHKGVWNIVDITFNDINETMGKYKHRADRPDPLKDSLGYWDWVFGTGRFQKIKTTTPEEFKKQMEEFEKIVNKIHTRTMKTENIWISDTMPDSVQVNGKKFKLVPVEEELTIRDCMEPVTTFDKRGSIVPATYRDSMINYPTKAIAEKVLLYGLLQSVAYKLNETKIDGPNEGRSVPSWWIYFEKGEFKTTNLPCSIDPLFRSNQLAKQAISIFAKSKFDLKKLYQ